MALLGLCMTWEALGRLCTCVHVYSWKKKIGKFEIEHTDQITLPGLGSPGKGVYMCTCVQLEVECLKIGS